MQPGAPGLRHAFAVALLLAVTTGIYFPSLSGPFVYDDKDFVVSNPFIRQLSLWPAYFTNFQTVAFGELAKDVYRPLMTFSFALDYALWGLNPFAYHTVNLFWHLLNVMLVYGLFLTLGMERPSALIGAALFAVHPVQTEVVSWVSGRAGVLSLAGTLGAFWAFIASRSARAPLRHWLYAAAVVAYLLGLFSKEMAATLPILLVAWLVLWRQGRAIATTLPFFVIFIFYFALRTAVLGRIAQTDYWAGSLAAMQPIMLRGVAFYLKQFVFPIHLSLEYTIPRARSVFDPQVMFALVVVALPLIAAALCRRQRVIVLGVAWFYITLLPVLNIIPINALVADRFLYLPSIGLAMAVGAAAGWAGQCLKFNWRKWLWVGGVAVMLCFAIRTVDRNRDWADPVRLWDATVRSAPWSAVAHYNLGLALVDNQKYAQADLAFRQALAIDPKQSAAANNLGNIAFLQGDVNQAVAFWKMAIAANPSYAEALYNLGVVSQQQGRDQEALHYYREFLRAATPDLATSILDVRQRVQKLVGEQTFKP